MAILLRLVLSSLLSPIGTDGNLSMHSHPQCTLLTHDIALLLVTTVLTTLLLPAHMQSEADAVFNTIAQFGQATGLAVMAVIAANVTDHSVYTSESSPDALLVGCRASYRACSALSCVGVAVGAWGLRSVGIVGVNSG